MIRTALTATVVMAAFVVAAAAGPAAAAAGDGRWYYDDFGIADHHAAGWTGDGITIAVLDGPVNTDVPTLKDANVEVREPSFCYGEDGKPLPATSTDLTGDNSAYHGTSVVSLISGTGDGYAGQAGVQGVAPGAKVLYYTVSQTTGLEAGGEVISCLDDEGNPGGTEIDDAMTEALDAGADIITVSAGYIASNMGDAYSRAIREGVIVLGSVGNTDDLEVSLGFPAGANGAVGVQAGSVDFQIQSTDGRPNDNSSTMVVGPGIGILAQGERDGAWEDQAVVDGTSLATPIVAGYLALAEQKWPDATGNQILQDLVRSPWDDGQVYFDAEGLTGFGYPTATRMLERDPAQYPDVNPFLDVRPVNIPSTDEIFNPAAGTPDPSATENPAPAPDSTPLVGIVIGVLVGALVLAGIIVVVVVLVVRRSRRKPPSGN